MSSCFYPNVMKNKIQIQRKILHQLKCCPIIETCHLIEIEKNEISEEFVFCLLLNRLHGYAKYVEAG